MLFVYSSNKLIWAFLAVRWLSFMWYFRYLDFFYPRGQPGNRNDTHRFHQTSWMGVSHITTCGGKRSLRNAPFPVRAVSNEIAHYSEGNSQCWCTDTHFCDRCFCIWYSLCPDIFPRLPFLTDTLLCFVTLSQSRKVFPD